MNQTRQLQRFTPYALSILLLSLGAPVVAQEAPLRAALEAPRELAVERNFSPELGDVSSAATLGAGPVPEIGSAGGPRQEMVIADVLLLEREAWRDVSADDALAAQQTAPKKGGFGRWLKKRWYIPVVAGVLLGVALADDSDAGEVDDD